MTLSVRMSDADGELVKSFAKMKNVTVSQLIRASVFMFIEKEYISLHEDMKKHQS